MNAYRMATTEYIFDLTNFQIHAEINKGWQKFKNIHIYWIVFITFMSIFPFFLNPHYQHISHLNNKVYV